MERDDWWRLRAKPSLVVFCGVPGSGKTTIARKLCDKMRGAVHVQTDVIRGMIVKPNYSGHESSFVYDSCVQVARMALRRGRPVVLDGTFARGAHRARAFRLLEGLYGRNVVVRLVCDLDTANRRNLARDSPVPEGRLRGIYASFEEPVGALMIDTEALSPEESVLAIITTLERQNSTLP
jgi:predicted kinase